MPPITLHISHLPPNLAVHIALYTSLRNSAYLRSQLLAGNPDFEYSLIDASTIVSTTHVLAAVFRATKDYLEGRLKSRNVHSEIVFSLGVNNNIATSLRTFGLGNTTTNLIVIKISTSPDITRETVAAHLSNAIEGDEVVFGDEELRRMTDLGAVRRIYRLGGSERGGRNSWEKERRKDGAVEGVGKEKGGAVAARGPLKGDGEEETNELEVGILGLMALRGAV